MTFTSSYPIISTTVDVRAFFPDTREFLLIERKNAPFAGSLALPGGYVEVGETLRESAARELFEETGFEVSPSILAPLMVLDAPDRDPRGRTISHVFSVVTWDAPTLKAADDASAVRLMSLDSIPVHNLAFDHGLVFEPLLRKK